MAELVWALKLEQFIVARKRRGGEKANDACAGLTSVCSNHIFRDARRARLVLE